MEDRYCSFKKGIIEYRQTKRDGRYKKIRKEIIKEENFTKCIGSLCMHYDKVNIECMRS
jgi:hypothetical protein